MSQAEQTTTNETMTVTVMYRNNWEGGDGWTYYPVTVTISAFCPKCGARRGEPYWKEENGKSKIASRRKWDGST